MVSKSDSDSDSYPYLNKWLSLSIPMKYLTNITILVSIVAYYTRAYWVFLVSIPLLITNAIVVCIVEWFNGDELTSAVLNIPSSQPDVVKNVKYKFMFINTIWHFIPLAWVWYILNKDNLIDESVKIEFQKSIVLELLKAEGDEK